MGNITTPTGVQSYDGTGAEGHSSLADLALAMGLGATAPAGTDLDQQAGTAEPTTRGDGSSALVVGDQWYDEDDETLNVWTGSAWAPFSGVTVAAAAGTDALGNPIAIGDNTATFADGSVLNLDALGGGGGGTTATDFSTMYDAAEGSFDLDWMAVGQVIALEFYDDENFALWPSSTYPAPTSVPGHDSLGHGSHARFLVRRAAAGTGNGAFTFRGRQTDHTGTTGDANAEEIFVDSSGGMRAIYFLNSISEPQAMFVDLLDGTGTQQVF